MNKRIVFVGFLAIWLLTGAGCSRQEGGSQDPSDYAPWLTAVDGAIEVTYGRNRGADQVHYTLKTPHPAEGFIESLNRRMGQDGWTPQKADFMNPDVPTAHATGWKIMTDYGVRPAARVHLWNGEWQNQAGDILVYVLSYRYPEAGPANLSDLDVMGLFIPRQAAEKAKQQVNKF